MKSKLIHEGEQKTFALVFEKGDELVQELTAFAKERGLNASHFTAIGAFNNAVLGFFDREKKDYKKIPLNEQVEVLSLIGDIAMRGKEPKLHAHVVVGTADGTAHGRPYSSSPCVAHSGSGADRVTGLPLPQNR